MVEPSKWLTDVALVHHQLSKSRSHETKNATETEPNTPNKSQKVCYRRQESGLQKQKHRSVLMLNKEIHQLWNCTEFKLMNVNQQYDFVKKLKWCFGCLGKSHSIKNCKVNPGGIDGSDRKHNRLLHENSSGIKINKFLLYTDSKSETNQTKDRKVNEDSCITRHLVKRTLIEKSLEELLKLDIKDRKRELA